MTKRNKILLTLIIVALACLSFGLGIVSVYASEPTFSEVTYESSYVIGDEFKVKAAKFTHNGKEYDAEGIVNYPSGKRISSNSVLLTESGLHYIDYVAKINDNLVSKKFYFTVLDSVYAIDGTGSIEFGKNEYFSDIGDVDGLNVALGKESTFKFNKIIDVSNLTRYDTVMQWYNTPKIVGSYEVRKVNFRLTDVYDSENWVEMQFKYSPDNGFSTTYIVANANGQLPSGLHYRDKGPSATSYEYNGYHYTLYQNNRHYGYNAEISFNGQLLSWKKDFSENCMRFAIDYEQKALYCTPAYGNNRDKCVVIDLDDERFFGDNLWNGFTTGEVLLSLNAEQYSTSQYNFFITEIYGHDVKDLYSANQIAPSITVDTLDFDENDLPDAVVGKEYKLFDAVANDESEGEIPYKTVVYYNYNNSSRAQINVKDGKFIPTREGEYTLIYSAKDSFGNSCEKLLTVNAVKKDKIIYTLNEHQKTFEVGEFVSVAEVDFGNAGKNYTLKISAKLENSDIEYSIDANSLSFRPLYAGKYVVTYDYSDYCFSDSFSYEITVNSTDTVKFVREPVFPRYIIKGCRYVFDAGEAYSFANGTEKVPVEIYVRGENIEKTKLFKNAYAVKNDVDTIELIYVAGNTEVSYFLPVVDVGYGKVGELNIPEYLQGDAFNYEASRFGTTYTTDETKSLDGKAKLSLVNKAYLINDFQITLTGVTGKANFDKLKISFTSLQNSSSVINFVYEKQADLSSIVTVSKGDYTVSAPSTSAFSSGDETGFSIVYANKEFIIGNSSLRIPYSTLFNNFGDYFYIDIELEGVYGESAIFVKKLVNQVINNSRYDTVKPTLIYGDFANSYVYGDTVHFGTMSCYDFIDINSKVSFFASVNGEHVTAKDGTLLNGIENSVDKEYDYVWDSYSDLYVKITAEDYSSNAAYDEPVLVMVDVVKPKITLEKAQIQCTINDNVSVAKYTVTDDRDGVTCVTILICPSGKTEVIKGEKFRATEWGTYTITYMATDAAGNVDFVSYNVICK